MKQYSHDYTLPQHADNLLQEALVKIRWDNYWDARLRIEEARKLLQQYLSQDNMVEDSDTEDGWVRAKDIVVTILGSDMAKATEHKVEKAGPKIVKHGKIDRQYNKQLDGVGDPSCPLYDKHIRISGTFEQIEMSRDEVAAACQKLGAKQVSDGIAKSMDIVILGNNAGPSKMEKIKLWQSEGHQIQTLSQFDIKKIFDEYLKAE